MGFEKVCSLFQPLQSLADRYARRLKKQGSLPNIDTTREEREASSEPEASFILQADALQSQWASLRSKVDSRSRLVKNLLNQLNEFNSQYDVLRKFVDEGKRLLEGEKPVGENATRLQEQVDTCQVRTDSTVCIYTVQLYIYIYTVCV